MYLAFSVATITFMETTCIHRKIFYSILPEGTPVHKGSAIWDGSPIGKGRLEERGHRRSPALGARPLPICAPFFENAQKTAKTGRLPNRSMQFVNVDTDRMGLLKVLKVVEKLLFQPVKIRLRKDVQGL